MHRTCMQQDRAPLIANPTTWEGVASEQLMADAGDDDALALQAKLPLDHLYLILLYVFRESKS